MISLNIRRAAFAATALIFLSTVSSAQKTYTFPHVLENNGIVAAIGWDLSGGQVEYVVEVDENGSPVVRRQFRPIGALFSLYGNDEVFTMVADAFAGKENGNSYSIYSLQKTVLGQNLAVSPQVSAVRFPACDVNSKEPGGVEVYFNPREYQLDKIRTAGDSRSSMAGEYVRRQKTWNPSNFRVKLGDLPCSRITAVSNAMGGTVNLPASRTATGFSLGDIALTIPLEDAPAFREVLRSTVDGKPIELPFRLEYLDENGLLLMALESTVYIASVDKENPLDPFDPSDPANKEKPVVVKVKKPFSGGHVTLIR